MQRGMDLLSTTGKDVGSGMSRWAGSQGPTGAESPAQGTPGASGGRAAPPPHHGAILGPGRTPWPGPGQPQPPVEYASDILISY